MNFFISIMLSAAAAAFSSSTQAQNVAGQDAAVYAVSYVEVAPGSSEPAIGALRQLAAEARKAEGNMRFEILQRLAPSNQFAIISIWQTQKSYDAYAAGGARQEFQSKIAPHLISMIDDRIHGGLEVAAGGAASGPGAVFVVTHVDVPPPKKDDCIAALKSLVDASRKEPGVARFEVFQQLSRPNHFSVTEIWNGQSAYEAHITAAHTKKFREQLTPMSGALYDERLYKAL
jgi:quinol monooxygenase YgiN